MELMQLRFFCHAAATESFVQTARRFDVPASSISHSMRRLENELGALLFERSPNRIKLSVQGQMFYHDIRQAMELIDGAVDRMSSNTNSGIKIGYLQGRTMVMKAFKQYTDLAPLGNMLFEKYDTRALPYYYDLVVTSDMLELDGYEVQHVLREPMILLVPKGLSDQMEITGETLRNQRFIMVSAKTSTYKNTVNFCRSLGFVPKIALQTDSATSFPECVSQGLGVAILPYQSWIEDFKEDMTDLFVLDGFFRDIYVYCKKRRDLSVQAKLFRDILFDVFDQMRQAEPPYRHLNLLD